MGKSSIYLDTNIVADMIDGARNNHKLSLELLKKLMLEGYDIFISEDMLSTLYYISNDKKATLEFFENIVYVDWNVVPFGIDVIKEATHLSLTKGLDLEDTLQCLCAKENACTMLVTNDKRFVDCGIEIAGYEKYSI
ncbi:MAG: PIN domain-containing protein [Sulfurovum sp.]|nr:MAG: PIN domain-containing protein [Sulfurovum sp.]